MPNVRVFYISPAPEQQTKLILVCAFIHYREAIKFIAYLLEFFKKKIKARCAEASEGEPNRRSLTEQGGSDSNDHYTFFQFFWRLGRLWGVILGQYKSR